MNSSTPPVPLSQSYLILEGECSSSALVEAAVRGEVAARIHEKAKAQFEAAVTPHLTASGDRRNDSICALTEMTSHSGAATQLTANVISSMLKRIQSDEDVNHVSLASHAQFIAHVSSTIRSEREENARAVAKLADGAREQELEIAGAALGVVAQIAKGQMSLVQQQVELLRRQETHDRALVEHADQFMTAERAAFAELVERHHEQAS